jgi:hypothetical protein
VDNKCIGCTQIDGNFLGQEVKKSHRIYKIMLVV